MTSKKGAIAVSRLMLFFIAAVTALVVILFVRDMYLERGGDVAESLIANINDVDGDGVPNNVDMCKPTACNPGNAPVEQNRENPRYGCASWQDPTPDLNAGTCNRREEAPEPTMIS